jgi:hypothetical protein
MVGVGDANHHREFPALFLRQGCQLNYEKLLVTLRLRPRGWLSEERIIGSLLEDGIQECGVRLYRAKGYGPVVDRQDPHDCVPIICTSPIAYTA